MLASYERSEAIDHGDRHRRACAPPARSSRPAARGRPDQLSGAVPNARTSASTPRSCAGTPRCCVACSTRPTRSSRACSTSASRRATSSTAPEQAMLEVAHDERTQDFRSISARVEQRASTSCNELSVAGESLTGTPTGFNDLDANDRRPAAGNLIVIAARPSMGKSCLVTNIAENGRISYRKPVRPVQPRDVRNRARATLHRLAGEHQGRRSQQGPRAGGHLPKIIKATNRLAAAPLWIDDSGDIGMLEIRAKARRLYSQPPRARPGDRRLPPAAARRLPQRDTAPR